MTVRDPEPWLVAAIGLLDVRRRDRLLACGVGAERARALAALVGREGELVVVDHAVAAAQLAAFDLPQVQALAHQLVGDEQFGTFDAMLVARATGPLLPLGAWAELARRNLRPGGRLVVDLPGTMLVPDLAAAWQQLGWDAERLDPLRGIGDDVLADTLRSAGLRSVHAVLGAHLLHASTPDDVVATYAEGLKLDAREQFELTHELVRQKGGAGPLDVLVHRTRVSALR